MVRVPLGMRKRQLTTQDFIDRSNDIHNNKYDYSLACYIKAHDFIKVICPIHGIFEQEANHHMRGKGCKKCASEISALNRAKTKATFIEEAKKLHQNRYDYNQVTYIRDSSKVDIVCPAHGIFKMSPNNHLRGQNCPRCSGIARGIINAENSTGWGLSKWSEAAIDSKTFDSFKLYFLKLSDDTESFCKIGRTYRELSERTRKLPYACETIHLLEHTDPKVIFDLETHLKRTFKTYKYTPLKKFNGMGECFKFDDPTIQSVLREMTLTSNSDIIPTSTK